MTWAKLDDRFYDDPKIETLGLAGTDLFCRALSYCARHLTDGRVEHGWVQKQLAELKPNERRRILGALLDQGLWLEGDGYYVISKYLEFNESRESVLARRSELHDVRSRAGQAGARSRWNGKRDGK